GYGAAAGRRIRDMSAVQDHGLRLQVAHFSSLRQGRPQPILLMMIQYIREFRKMQTHRACSASIFITTLWCYEQAKTRSAGTAAPCNFRLTGMSGTGIHQATPSNIVGSALKMRNRHRHPLQLIEISVADALSFRLLRRYQKLIEPLAK
ncbi:MAG: hypothetical protein ACOY3O_11080, partial [Thermodesulfobacteriota bacterium]